MADFDAQLKRMQSLISYGKVEENTKRPSNYTLEFHEEGADGKSYGIIRECNKFYIKTTTPDKALVAESYQYIGGFNNKKDYEYTSYSNALKNLELKVESVRRAHAAEQDVDSIHLFEKEVPLMNEATDEMRKSLARYRQIMYNSSVIMNEEAIGRTPFTNQPEAAKGHSGDEDAPFTQVAKPDMEFDGVESSEPEKQGAPFGDTEKAEKGEDIKVDGSVASEHPAGGKVTRVDECDDKMFNAGLPEEAGVGDAQEIEWVNEEDEELMTDDEEGEELEDDEADDLYLDDEELEDEDEEEYELDDEPEDELEDEEELEDDEELEDEEDSDLEDEDDEELDIELDGEDSDDDLGLEDEELEDEEEYELEDEPEFDEDSEDELEDEEEEEEFEEDMDECGDYMMEAKNRYMNSIVESVVKSIKEEQLHDFGKHPGYRKKPMDLPETGSDETVFGHDWNDESVYSEEPFGQSKGDSKPFDKVVDVITAKVMESLKKK